jgi:hypothetical protein
VRTRRPRRRASTLGLDAIVLPDAPKAPEAPKVAEPTPKPQQPVSQGNPPFKGWKVDQERWVKETGRWGR